MRRKDKETKDRELISQIIRSCHVCRLGLAKDNTPYIVPVSFGYDGSSIYFHTARDGKKIDYINANNAVCIEFERGVSLVPHAEDPCKWTFSFQSVVGYGKIHELVSVGEKTRGLNQVMKHYSSREWDLGEASLDNVRVWQIKIETISGKQSKDRAAT